MFHPIGFVGLCLAFSKMGKFCGFSLGPPNFLHCVTSRVCVRIKKIFSSVSVKLCLQPLVNECHNFDIQMGILLGDTSSERA